MMITDKSILVVDDEFAIRDAISTYLKQLHIKVDSAENGIEALHLILSKHYDLIILDISMPYLNGITFSEAMKVEGQMTPLLIISAKEPAHRLWQEAGRLIKPFSLKSLKNEIDKILRSEKNMV